jgi:hypothetical protein
MQKKLELIIVSVFLFTMLITVGCGGPTSARVAKEPNYPSLADIPPVPVYEGNDTGWDAKTTCWIGVADDATWNNIGSEYARANFSRDLVPLMRAELISEGYQIKMFGSDYITRERRLSIQKLILCKDFNVNKTMVREGQCFDMKLSLIVINNLQQDQKSQCEIWARLVLGKDESMQCSDIYRTCVANMRKVPEFRRSLAGSSI